MKQSNSVFVAALVLLCASALSGQQAAGPTGPIPPNLDEMIATALKSSPEVLLAEAKVRQAQAELNQTRLKVTRDVVGAFNERKQRQVALEGASSAYQQVKQQVGNGALSKTDLDHARSSVGAAELGIAQSEADIRYLLGIGSKLDPVVQTAAAPKKVRNRPDPPPEIAEALKRPVSGTFTTNLTELAARIATQAKVSILIDHQTLTEPNETKIELALREPVVLMSLFQALSDQYQFCFVLRDYGILVTTEDKARNFVAASIPENLPLDDEAR